MEASLAELRDRIVSAQRARTPLQLRGAGTKDFFGERLVGELLDTRAHAGIVSYEPSELVISARCGTPLSEIERVLGQNGQFLAFEPPSFGADPTIGGVVAAGLSGPRRASAGAVRDYVLGAHLLGASGELLRFGGQVMKNVAGFDVSRLLCGSLGILGLIAEVSLKVLPRPRAETTLAFEFDASNAVAQFNRWAGRPLPISATAWHAGRACVRLSGADSALRAARCALGGEAVDDAVAAAWWRSLRDQTHTLFNSAQLWRLSLPSTAPMAPLGGELIEWSGALRWVHSDAAAAGIRVAVAEQGGTAMLWRGPRDAPMFHPLPPASLGLHRRLKLQFDPHGIFNAGRLIADL
ncbi:MAG: glycolate oxidase subunit GlcE [Rudaea sp.]|nr:glycolate oxidase subunit GlcE [Rudaea sp.]